MKLKQLFKAAPLPKKIKVKEAAEGQCGGNRKAKAEDEELTTITAADYKEWLKQMDVAGKKMSRNGFADLAWDVLDNDPKLGSTDEIDLDHIVTKLWNMYKGT